MTTIDESTVVAQRTLEPSEDDRVHRQAQAWQLGILTDRAGHVHLGAVVAGTGGEPCAYLDLLAPVAPPMWLSWTSSTWSCWCTASSSPTSAGLSSNASTMSGSER